MTDILTITMNPAVDVFTSTANVRPAHKLRCGPALVHPGGGGINVARVLARLDVRALALYPAGGLTGGLLRKLLEAEGVPGRAVAIAGETRESFTVHDEGSGQDYRFVLQGPQLTGAEWQACLEAAVTVPVASRLVVASGSLPPGVPDDFYARLARRLATQGVRLALDTSGPALAAALEAGVYLVKPSLRELGDLTGAVLDTPAQRLAACRSMVQAGRAEVVALSLGAEGALLVTREGAWQAAALAVQVASTVGAGDSFLGALLVARCRGMGFDQALARGIAASAAALLTSGTALCQPADLERLLPQVRLQPVG